MQGYHLRDLRAGTGQVWCFPRQLDNGTSSEAAAEARFVGSDGSGAAAEAAQLCMQALHSYEYGNINSKPRVKSALLLQSSEIEQCF